MPDPEKPHKKFARRTPQARVSAPGQPETRPEDLPADQHRKYLESEKKATDVVPTLTHEGATEYVGGFQTATTRPKLRVTEYGCELIRFYRSRALPIPLIARRLNITNSVFYDLISRQPEVKEALEVGLAEMEFTLTECLMSMAERGVVIAAIYLTKVLHKWRDNDPPPAVQQSNVIIQLPASMSLEDLKRLREQGVTPMQLAEANAPAIETDAYEVKDEQ